MAHSVRAGFSARFRRALDEAGYGHYRLSELGPLFGVSGQAVRKWLHGDALPSSTRAGRVSSVLGVRRAWLLDDEAPMRSLAVTESGRSYEAGKGGQKGGGDPGGTADSISLSAEEFRFLSRYRRLPRELQQSLDNMLDALDTLVPAPGHSSPKSAKAGRRAKGKS